MTVLDPRPPMPVALPEPESLGFGVLANLLPDEIVAARRLGALKRKLVAGLGAVVLLLALVYAWSWWQTSNAQDDLESAQQQASTLQSEQNHYQPLLAMQGEASSIRATLGQLMTQDVQWSVLDAALQNAAAGTATITNVTATLATSTAASNTNATNGPAPTTGGRTVIGSLVITGSARNSSAVGTFLTKLATLKQLSEPVPSSLAGQKSSYSFTVTAALTSAAIGGRFTVTNPSAAGTSATPGGN